MRLPFGEDTAAPALDTIQVLPAQLRASQLTLAAFPSVGRLPSQSRRGLVAGSFRALGRPRPTQDGLYGCGVAAATPSGLETSRAGDVARAASEFTPRGEVHEIGQAAGWLSSAADTACGRFGLELLRSGITSGDLTLPEHWSRWRAWHAGCSTPVAQHAVDSMPSGLDTSNACGHYSRRRGVQHFGGLRALPQ